jgi:exopolysaccharide production protein ExoZ
MKLNGLQIARGLAAFAIVYFHSWVILLSFPKDTDHPIMMLKLWGYLSIDFFFAISGFVICLVATRPGFTTASFLIKRVFRLYPMYLSCLAVYGATSILRNPAPVETLASFVYSATLLPTRDYPFYGVAWSLQHEILFYIVAAVTVPFIGLRGLASILFASAAVAIWLDIPLHSLPISKYHADFLAGVLAFLASPYLRRIGCLIPLVIGCAGIYLVVSWGATNYFCIPFFVLMIAVVNYEPASKVIRPLIFLGDLSYSMYLIHPLVFGIGYKIMVALQPLPFWLEEYIRWAAIFACVPVSYLTWRFIEKPMIRLGERLSAGMGKKHSPQLASEASAR